MLTIAKCLANNHDVSIFWDKDLEEIKRKSESKLGIDLTKVKFTKNIFSSETKFLERYLASRNFDLIVYLSDGSIPVVASKLVVHFQFPVEWIQNSIKTKLKLLRVKKIICNSEFTKSLIDKKFSVQSDVVYPPVSVQSPASKENVIFHVGRFGLTKEGVNYKKQDVMIEAFKKLVDDGLKGWEFVLVIGVKRGDEEKVEYLKKQISKYPIKIVENPTREILKKYYSASKIYWHASGFGEDLEKHPEYAEHFGISTVEAMGAGAVPVVINAGGQPEIVIGGSGFLWNRLDELKARTLELINNNELWKKMSKAAVKRAEFFSGERFCKQLVEIIK